MMKVSSAILIKMRPVVQIKATLMYRHQKNKGDSAVADD